MANPVSRQEAAARDFPGMVSSQGSGSTNPGVAAIQVNLISNVMGEIKVRPGMREVVFDDGE